MWEASRRGQVRGEVEVIAIVYKGVRVYMGIFLVPLLSNEGKYRE